MRIAVICDTVANFENYMINHYHTYGRISHSMYTVGNNTYYFVSNMNHTIGMQFHDYCYAINGSPALEMAELYNLIKELKKHKVLYGKSFPIKILSKLEQEIHDLETMGYRE